MKWRGHACSAAVALPEAMNTHVLLSLPAQLVRPVTGGRSMSDKTVTGNPGSCEQFLQVGERGCAAGASPAPAASRRRHYARRQCCRQASLPLRLTGPRSASSVTRISLSPYAPVRATQSLLPADSRSGSLGLEPNGKPRKKLRDERTTHRILRKSRRHAD